ncbi:hypothetical protein [Sporosarcina psychrophila]|uniref:hypothetical protein n=1 Tax=Sporosarcina psychrophila TaxID=1476 RepID=UPI00078DC054|nr:hypothetical protein [Sporosarcina psychrophila]AMQ07130.1 hypothetical protein AZE41_15005 [Sporosarcina psychrophila]
MQVYAQHAHHLESIIVGNREGLIELRNAIDQALDKGTGKGNLFPSDDEGYELYVSLIPDEEHKVFSLLELPYTIQFGEKNTQCLFPYGEYDDKEAPYSPATLFNDEDYKNYII